MTSDAAVIVVPGWNTTRLVGDSSQVCHANPLVTPAKRRRPYWELLFTFRTKIEDVCRGVLLLDFVRGDVPLPDELGPRRAVECLRGRSNKSRKKEHAKGEGTRACERVLYGVFTSPAG